MFEERSSDELLGFQPHQFQRFALHQIAFRHRHHATLDSQQAADIEMLARLRLDGFVRGDHQEQHINTARARQHVADEALVPRHIYKTEAHPVFFQECKTQIDGDSPALLFGQTIWVRAGQRFDQR